MSLLQEDDIKKLEELFQGLKDDVNLILFVDKHDCEYCAPTRELLEEVAALSLKINLEVHDLKADAELAGTFNIDKTPATVIMGRKDFGIRFFGIPAGYEFTTFIEDIIDVSANEHGLADEIVEALLKINNPMNIEVIVSPSCPYCAGAVRTAHKFAIACEMITGHMIEGSEFPAIAEKYEVKSVPVIVLNEKTKMVGAVPELEFVQAVLKASGIATTENN